MKTAKRKPAKPLQKKPCYTTTEVARLLGISPNVVRKLIDQKRLQGYRLMGKHRRISHDSLIAFARANPAMSINVPGGLPV